MENCILLTQVAIIYYMAVRVKTGIPGLDGLIEGGLLQKCVYLVTGETGSGKTIFVSQFLWNGLLKGETCLFITLEESPEEIKEDVARFGWDLDKFEKKKMLKIIYHDPAQVDKLGTLIQNEVVGLKANRLVIDSAAAMSLAIDNKSLIRRRIASIVSSIKKHEDCTALITTEVPENSKALSRFDVEEFVVDGIFVLNYLGGGNETPRSLTVRKMRRTDHGKDIYPMEINEKGITIKKAGF